MANEVNDRSDQVERVNQGDRTSENTSKDSVIGGDRKDHQKIHQEASTAGHTFGTFSDNDDDQSFQAMKPGETLEQYQARLAQRKEQEATKPQVDAFGIDFGDGSIETSKGKIEIAQAPKEPGKEAKANDQPLDGFVEGFKEGIRDGLKEGVNLAWEMVGNPAWSAWNEMLDYRWRSLPKGAYKDYLEGRTTSFDVEKEGSAWRSIDLKACEKAYDTFSDKFAKYGISKAILGGTMLDELTHRDPLEWTEDLSIQIIGTVRTKDGSEKTTASVGPGQLQLRNIRRLVEARDAQGNSKYPVLQQFKDDPYRAAIDPQKAPFFVAAYYADVIDQYEAFNQANDEKIPINDETLLFSYNPDVYSLQTESGHKEFRTIQPGDQVEWRVTKTKPEWMQKWHKEFVPIGETAKHSGHVKSAMKALNVIRHYR